LGGGAPPRRPPPDAWSGERAVGVWDETFVHF
jgi:hypothetical protein